MLIRNCKFNLIITKRDFCKNHIDIILYGETLSFHIISMKKKYPNLIESIIRDLT